MRVVAATHRDLQAMVADGTFREDLWYRLAVFPIRLPPLRERADDIAAMAVHFASRAAKRFGLPMCRPTLDDLRLLTGYAWPGNVRELASVIDRAAVLGEGKRLEIAASLGISPLPGLPAPSQPTRATAQRGKDFPTLDRAMAEHIAAALKQTRGQIEGRHGAPNLLGINPHTLRARMRKLGIRCKSTVRTSERVIKRERTDYVRVTRCYLPKCNRSHRPPGSPMPISTTKGHMLVLAVR